MARYIDADKKIHIQIFDEEHEEYIMYEHTIADCLDSYTDEGCPEAADVQEVRHAHWVKSETDRQYCSICHEVRPYYFKETLVNGEQKEISLINWECPYCPHCGAKMGKKEEEIV